MMFLPMVVIVSYYFDKKRAIATCIAVSGSGVGIFICAPFCRWMLETYDWRNVLVIISGLNLQGLWLGALLRPIKPSIKPPFEEVSSVNEGEYLDPKVCTILYTIYDVYMILILFCIFLLLCIVL